MQTAVANAMCFNNLAVAGRAERLERQQARGRILVASSKKKPSEVADPAREDTDLFQCMDLAAKERCIRAEAENDR